VPSGDRTGCAQPASVAGFRHALTVRTELPSGFISQIDESHRPQEKTIIPEDVSFVEDVDPLDGP
jgi:hypothetical protein